MSSDVRRQVRQEQKDYEESVVHEALATKEELVEKSNLIPIDQTGKAIIDKLTKDYYPEEVRDHLLIPADRIKPLISALKTMNKNLIKFVGPMICKGPKCHPAGSLIRTNIGDIPIEKISTEHTIYSWQKNSNSILLPKKNYKHKLYEKDYYGVLYKFTVNDLSFECTNDHPCIARWNEKAKDLYAVYLMNRGDTWRIGQIKLFKSRRNQSGLSPRCLTEKADRAWILGVYKTKQEAYMAEDYFSVDFGISKMCFIAKSYNNSNWNSSLKWVTQNQLDKHHNILKKDESFYEKKLAQFGLLIQCPFWIKGKTNKRGFRSSFEIEACNFISEYMDMAFDIDPHLIKRRNIRARWQTASRESRIYEGKVYMIEVYPYHTYLVNNIVTHNCAMEVRCPMQKSGIAPIGHNCPIELMLIDQWEIEYLEDLGVDKQSKIELDLVRDMIESDLMDWRTSNDIAANGMFDWNAIGVTNEGKAIYKKDEAISINIKLKFKARKDRLREDLMATRKVRARFGLTKSIDPSKLASSLQERYQKIKEAEVSEISSTEMNPKKE